MPLNFTNTPLFERRGLMLDISRNRVPTMAWLKTLVDVLAALRYNELQLYTEHTFAYRQHPDVWKDASPFTPEEIQEIDRYCRERGIELVANQNSFGHMERWLLHEPYRQLSECPEGFIHPISGKHRTPSTLYPSKESLQLIDGLYAELLPNFSSSQIHVGGDEPWELGRGRSKDRAKTQGKHRIYLDYMNGIFALAEKYGCRAQFWADIILERPELVAELPANVLPVIWGYEADSPFDLQCEIVAAAGFKNNFYVAPGAGNWNSFSGRLDVARANIANAAKHGHANGAKGLLLTAWGDNGHHQPWPTLFPPLVMAAQAAWDLPIDDQAVAETIDQLWYANSNPGHGQALLQLGKVDAILPQPAPPSSFLHAVFFAETAQMPGLMTLIDRKRLETAEVMLGSVNSEALDPEIEMSVRLSKIAVTRCKEHIHKTDHALARHQHRQESIIDAFKSLWLRRSRPGGLTQSARLLSNNE